MGVLNEKRCNSLFIITDSNIVNKEVFQFYGQQFGRRWDAGQRAFRDLDLCRFTCGYIFRNIYEYLGKITFFLLIR